MIPTLALDFAKMIVESEPQRAEVEGVLAALSAEQALWGPVPSSMVMAPRTIADSSGWGGAGEVMDWNGLPETLRDV